MALSFEVPAALQGEYRGAAGQHVVLRLDIDGQEVRRTYSLLNAPGEWPLRIAPRVHAHGRMSRYLAEQLPAGAAVEVLPPNGSFTPRTRDCRRQLTWPSPPAAVSPRSCRCCARCSAQGAASVILFYGNTGTARMMCAEELLALKDRNLGRLAVHFLMSREPQEAAALQRTPGCGARPRVRAHALRCPARCASTSSAARGT